MSKHQQIQQAQNLKPSSQRKITPASQIHVSHPASIIQRARINPKSLTSADVLQLQRTIGNNAVGRLLSEIRNPSKVQQATIQRQEIPEEEEPLQGKIAETIQRQKIPEEEEPLQSKMTNKSSQVKRTVKLIGIVSNVTQMMKPEITQIGKKFHVRYNGELLLAIYIRPSESGNFVFQIKEKEVEISESDIIKPMDGISRIERALKRAEKRPPQPELGKKTQVPTLFGMTGISRQPFSKKDPQVTTSAEDFEGAKAVGSRYSQFTPKVGDQGNWQVVSEVIDKKRDSVPETFTPTQKRGAAMLVTTTQKGEQYRFPPAPKISRSAIRKIASGEYKPAEFHKLFPMAEPGGAHYYEGVLKGDTKMTEDQSWVAEAMSESSDEAISESSDDEVTFREDVDEGSQ